MICMTGFSNLQMVDLNSMRNLLMISTHFAQACAVYYHTLYCILYYIVEHAELVLCINSAT